MLLLPSYFVLVLALAPLAILPTTCVYRSTVVVLVVDLDPCASIGFWYSPTPLDLRCPQMLLFPSHRQKM